MRGLKQLRCVQVITAGHAFIQNIRRGHYELGAEETVNLRSGLPSTNSSWRSDQPRLTILPAPTPHNATAPSELPLPHDAPDALPSQGTTQSLRCPGHDRDLTCFDDHVIPFSLRSSAW
jgi:hypothetical protein